MGARQWNIRWRKWQITPCYKQQPVEVLPHGGLQIPHYEFNNKESDSIQSQNQILDPKWSKTAHTMQNKAANVW